MPTDLATDRHATCRPWCSHHNQLMDACDGPTVHLPGVDLPVTLLDLDGEPTIVVGDTLLTIAQAQRLAAVLRTLTRMAVR